MAKPIYNENIQIEGKETKIEIFKYFKENDCVYKIVKTISFIDADNICLVVNNNSRPSLAGGKVEEGETPEFALQREVREELNARVVEYFPLAVIKYNFLEENRIDNMLIYQSKIELLDGKIEDPDGDIKGRLIVNKQDFAKTFNSSSQMIILSGLLDLK